MYNVTYSILEKQTKPLEIWSCNPADIPPWTLKEKQRLWGFLASVFGWKDEPRLMCAVDDLAPYMWTGAMLTASKLPHRPYPLNLFSFTEKVDPTKADFRQRYQDFIGTYYK